MKCLLLLLALLSTDICAQMEKRMGVLYDRKAFQNRNPAVGKKMLDLKLRDLNGKKVDWAALRKKPVVVIGGAYT